MYWNSLELDIYAELYYRFSMIAFVYLYSHTPNLLKASIGFFRAMKPRDIEASAPGKILWKNRPFPSYAYHTEKKKQSAFYINFRLKFALSTWLHSTGSLMVVFYRDCDLLYTFWRIISVMSEMNNKPERPIKILLVNGVRLMGNVIAAALEDEPDIQVVGCVTNLDEAMKIAQEKDVDVALVNTRLPDQGALKLTSAITEWRLPPRF